MKILPLALALAAVPLLSSLNRRADPVSFHPADGSSLAKEFTISVDLTVGDASMMMDGIDAASEMPDDLGFNVEFEMNVSDEYVKTVEGKPLELIRSFGALSGMWEGSGGGDSDSGDVEGFGKLENQKVRFQWDEETKEYKKTFHESEGDAALLEALDVDMDLRALLPTGEVSVGDTWQVPADRLDSIVFFGGIFDNIGEDDENAEIVQALEDELTPQLEALAKAFTFKCEYKGQRAAGDAQSSVIAITLEGKGDLDLRSAIETLMDAQMPEGMEFEMTISAANLGLELTGTGELLWNQRAGHLHSFNMNADVELMIEVDMSADVQGEKHSMEASVEVLGEGEWTATAV